ncbi:MAG: hypothetical protein R6U38_15715, partial [Desulfatiglandaceae bacterium]
LHIHTFVAPTLLDLLHIHPWPMGRGFRFSYFWVKGSAVQGLETGKPGARERVWDVQSVGSIPSKGEKGQAQSTLRGPFTNRPGSDK